MRRRVACLSLPEIRLELASERLLAGAGGVFAVVVARPGGAVKTERDVLGATKLDVVSRKAHALGARAGQTVAAARAKCTELRVCVVGEDEVRSALERVAEVALAFGPSVAIDVAHDVVWVEIGGCAHLHGTERKLAEALAAKVRGRGHACRIAIADGPRVASAVARFGPASRGRRGRSEPGSDAMIVPEGKGAAAMHVLPIGALELDDATTIWLDGLGLRSCGALQKLPRRALGTRLGARTHDVMQLLDGEDRTPLDPWRPPEVPEEHATLEWGASSVEALAFVVRALSDRLAARLESRAVGATCVELVLDLDRALCGGPASVAPIDPRRIVRVVLPSPIARAADLFAVVRARLERETLPAPVLEVTLRTPAMASASGQTLDLLTPEPKADRALPRLVAEIEAELGEARVGTLELVDTWIPERRTRLLAFGARAARTPHDHALSTRALEPSRLVRGGLLQPSVLDEAELLVRIEAVEWWRQEMRSEKNDPSSRPAARHDWFATWTQRRKPRGVAGLAWVERVVVDHAPNRALTCTDEVTLRGWID
ncbi:MAG: DNA polymerase Y family protein [Polyangiaceae bacterium]|nr:DNA polymerase Y family protein [Polyangiaceae bacterium]